MQHRFLSSLDKAVSGISHYLKQHLLENGKFPARTFYAEAFALNFFSKRGELTSELKQIIQQNLDQKDQRATEFHGEFLQYLQEEWKEYPLKNHTVTNWILLKSLLLVRHKKGGYEEAKKILRRRQTSDGCILDDKHVWSLQYHCFSMVLLFELWNETGDEEFYHRFERGLGFIKNFILYDGSSLYIGRGQEQLFGYASLVYVLSVSGEYNLLDRVVSYIMHHQREDGSFPLVLRRGEAKTPFEPDLQSDRYLGWYGYNNYFDYLAFAGYFFQKSLDALRKKPQEDHHPLEACSIKGVFRKISKKRYEAVLAKPGGPITNGLSIPFIVSQKHGKLTPCYGGEEVLPSLTKKIDVPMPYFPRFKKTLRNKGIFWMGKDSLFTFSPLGYMKRTFRFDEERIQVQTSVRSPFSFVHQYLFFDDVEQVSDTELKGKGYCIYSKQPLLFSRMAYCPIGRVKVFTTSSASSLLDLHLIDE